MAFNDGKAAIALIDAAEARAEALGGQLAEKGKECDDAWECADALKACVNEAGRMLNGEDRAYSTVEIVPLVTKLKARAEALEKALKEIAEP